jgi:hypothetical protein
MVYCENLKKECLLDVVDPRRAQAYKSNAKSEYLIATGLLENIAEATRLALEAKKLNAQADNITKNQFCLNCSRLIDTQTSV